MDMEGIESVTISTDEASVTFSPEEWNELVERRAMSKVAHAADRLMDVEPEVTEYEFKITGATGFEGGKDLHVNERVTVSVGGVVTGVGVVVKQRKSEFDDGELEDYLVRVVTIKATGALIR